jgi:hypothetical protein
LTSPVGAPNSEHDPTESGRDLPERFTKREPGKEQHHCHHNRCGGDVDVPLTIALQASENDQHR